MRAAGWITLQAVSNDGLATLVEKVIFAEYFDAAFEKGLFAEGIVQGAVVGLLVVDAWMISGRVEVFVDH